MRVFSEHLTDDELMSCHWGYPHTGRWEDVGVLRRGEHHLPDGLLGQDYWLVGDELVLLMHYSGPGGFIGAEVLPPGEVARFVRDREAAWDAAEPFTAFTAWWARHPELHRHLAA